ncbi:MAG: hypothetical protein IIB56_04750, partial [Planctomycetes bacterium]|nr:hypothetical protein [Planctomycetota bacterium]
MCKKLIYLVSFVLVPALATSLCSATVAPVTSVTTDNPPGSPPYNLLSITVGSYTVDVSRLASGTSTTTLDPVNGTAVPLPDDLEIGLQYNAGETTDAFTVHMFGGKLWTDSNGDNPDFFLFEAGNGDNASIAAILPGGQVGQAITLPEDWGGDTGYDSSLNGQNIVGISFAITDLLDAAGNPLTNSSIIEGLAITDRSGLDPSDWCAVVPPPALAKNPNPADKATDVPRDVSLSWTPGEFAALVNGHKVYFGQSFNDVNDATGGVAQDANSYTPAQRLDFNTTYYWRIDEVNA